MTLKSEPFFQPRMPGQQADIAPGSPLAVVALFTEIIRERFRPGNDLPWVWNDNPTPDDSERATEDAPRKLFIEPAFNENTETRNYRPAIYIDKGDTVVEKNVINNQVGQQLRTGYKGFYALTHTPISLEVISGNKGESATIADIAWFYILAGREQIRATFNIHDVSNPTLSRTQPMENDKTIWSTTVSFEVTLEFRWTTLPISPLLNEVVLRFRKSDEPDVDAFLLRKYNLRGL